MVIYFLKFLMNNKTKCWKATVVKAILREDLKQNATKCHQNDADKSCEWRFHMRACFLTYIQQQSVLVKRLTVTRFSLFLRAMTSSRPVSCFSPGRGSLSLVFACHVIVKSPIEALRGVGLTRPDRRPEFHSPGWNTLWSVRERRGQILWSGQNQFQ